ncbi:MAG TPA: glycosyl hydrolase family 65 protein [Acidimicrobiales bacterium]|nr:glycosyl hydrolase family 65 protein [Acidimicrobiales bacterium]
MLKREITPPPEHIFPSDDPWRIVETRWTDHHSARAETIFSLANGYIGMRGTVEEGRPALEPGTFVNGFHETWPIVHAEEAYGLARTGQTIVNVPDTTLLKLYVGDEPLLLPVARMHEYSRVLDMRAGTLTRDLVWSTPSGIHVRVRSQRLVSMEQRHVAAMSYEVTVLDVDAPVVVTSQVLNREDARPDEENGRNGTVDPRQAPSFAHRVLEGLVADHDGARLLLGYRTTNSRMTLGIGVDHVIDTAAPHTVSTEVGSDLSSVVVTVDAQAGVPIRIVKYVAFQHSRRVAARELVRRCGRTLDRVVRNGYEALLEGQRAELDRFWERADVVVEPVDPAERRVQQSIRWNLFQVAQAAWRAEGSGIPAKGLTGSAYEGHYFWDIDVYVLPFLSYTQPRIARNLLRFRHSMLDQARRRAAELSHDGAAYPWRTINGDEASAAFQAGTAQYHLNADIAYAIRKYVDVRGDVGFLAEVGAEILVETARMWLDLGFFGDDGRFHIHSVTGPDEYTTVVNDNAFTNLMARLNLHYAASAVRRLRDEMPEAHAALAFDVALRPDEPDEWDRAGAAMYVPFDPERGIHPQDETFLEREMWDLEGTPDDRFPLLLHFHPLVIYRFQVLKQADVVLAMFLLGNEFDLEQKRRNFDYYDPITTGDSSLSACVQSIVAAEIGDLDSACRYFDYALMMDLADVAGNTSDGVHIASAGGVWMALAFGFGGVRDFDGKLSIDPHLPARWRSLTIPLRFQDRQLRLRITAEEESVELVEGEPLEITMRGVPHLLEPGAPLRVDPRS